MPVAPAVENAIDFLAREGDVGEESFFRNSLKQALATRVYGPIFGAMVSYGKDLVEAGHFDPHAVAGGLHVVAGLYTTSNGRYHTQERTLTDEEMDQHHDDVLNGQMNMVPEHGAMTVEHSIEQVVHADMAFCGDTDNVGYEAAVAAANYGAIFVPKSMASATRILDRSEVDVLLKSIDGHPEYMPHLSVSNWAIGQTFTGIVDFAAEHDIRLRVFDLCSGHGATFAAMGYSVSQSSSPRNLPEMAFTLIETTPKFYEELVGFAQGTDGARMLDLDTTEFGTPRQSISQFGAVTTVFGNVPKIFPTINVSNKHRGNEIGVLTVNYGMHRLPSDKKIEIFNHFAQLDNSIILIGDLVQNTSDINRRLFNIAANGPSNTGNKKTAKHLKDAGYVIIDLAAEQPATLDPRFAQQLVADSRSTHRDGHFWIAVKGPLALQALGIVPINELPGR